MYEREYSTAATVLVYDHGLVRCRSHSHIIMRRDSHTKVACLLCELPLTRVSAFCVNGAERLSTFRPNSHRTQKQIPLNSIDAVCQLCEHSHLPYDRCSVSCVNAPPFRKSRWVGWARARKTQTRTIRPNPHRTQSRDTRVNWNIFSFDVACVQCGYPHSHQQVPFAHVALHVASRVLCGLGSGWHLGQASFPISL